MSTRQQAVKLLDLFEKRWHERYNKKYKGNRHSDQWGFRDMIDDLGFARAKEVVEYYFNLNSPDHSRQWLIYNYEKVNDINLQVVKDKEERKRIMERTRESIGE